MFNITTLGVIICIIFVSGCLWAILYYTKGLIAKEKILFQFMFIVTLVTSTWAMDKLVAFRTSLLTDEESGHIFEMMILIVGITIGYFMRGKKEDL